MEVGRLNGLDLTCLTGPDWVDFGIPGYNHHQVATFTLQSG